MNNEFEDMLERIALAPVRLTVASAYCAGIVPGQTESRWDALEILRHKVITLSQE